MTHNDNATASDDKTTAFTEAANAIADWRSPLLVAHARPDGDAIGSLVAMQSILRLRGIAATVLLFEPLPDQLTFLGCGKTVIVRSADDAIERLDAYDGLIVLDTCAYGQLSPIADWLRTTRCPKVVVDHHVTRDDLADHYVIDESAAAACLILYDWARAMDWETNAQACRAMFVGIATDTGWFHHSNTDARVLSAAADLASRGVVPCDLYDRLFMTDTIPRVRLVGAALSTLELLVSDRLAVMSLTQEVMHQVGAGAGDTEGIINEPMRVESVIVSVLLVEAPGGLIRASFRSKPPSDTKTPVHGETSRAAPQTHDIDVAQIAQAFGGGGHRRAAGARITGSITDARASIVEHITRAIKPQESD